MTEQNLYAVRADWMNKNSTALRAGPQLTAHTAGAVQIPTLLSDRRHD